MPLLEDGVYKIQNAEFTDFVATFNRVPSRGPISGSPDSDSDQNKWRLVNKGGGGDQVTLESIAYPGYYAQAQVDQPPNDSYVVTSTKSTVWTVVNLDKNQFHILAPDYANIWDFPIASDYAPIFLNKDIGRDYQKWYFEFLYP